jgi:hypothetical protein
MVAFAQTVPHATQEVVPRFQGLNKSSNRPISFTSPRNFSFGNHSKYLLLVSTLPEWSGNGTAVERAVS